MPNGNTIEQALGNLYVAMNRPLTHQSPKLAPVKDRDELLDLAVAYCFDLQRKLEYACAALEPFAEFAEPDLAWQLADDDAELCDKRKTWGERKQLAERIMLELSTEIAPRHDDVVKRKADESPPPGPGGPKRRWPKGRKK